MNRLGPPVRRGGRPAHAGRPLFSGLRVVASAALLALGLAACTGGGSPLPTLSPSRPLVADAERVEDVRDELAPLPPQARRDYALAQLQASGLAPIADAAVPGRPDAGRYILAPTSTGAAVLAGRVPAHRDSLVVAVLALDAPSEMAAFLEGVRLLSARATYVLEPARSLFVAVGEPEAGAWKRVWASSRIVGRVEAPGSAADALSWYERLRDATRPEGGLAPLTPRDS